MNTATKIYDASNPVHAQAAKTITIKNPTEPATISQVSFLNSLCKSRQNDTVIAQVRYAMACNALTKGMASKFIDTLKASPAKGSAAAAAQSAPEPAKPVVPAELPMPGYGYYVADSYGTETVFCFDSFKGKYSNQVKLMKLKKTEVYDYKQGKYVPKGKWMYAGGTYQAKKILAGLAPITVAAAAKMGSTVGFCIRCGRTLTDPESVAAGIGPVCVTYTNWGI